MCKTRTYDKTKIEVCRNCLGSGVVPAYQDGPTVECCVCKGSGRVNKTLKIEITIEPYSEPRAT